MRVDPQQVNSSGVCYYRRARSRYPHQTTSWTSAFIKLGTTRFGRTSSLRGSVGSGEYCAMVDAEAEHCNVWQCSIAEDASGKDLCFHVVTVHHKSTTSGQARCT